MINIDPNAAGKNLPFFLYDNFLAKGTRSVSSTAAGTHMDNVLGPQTFDYWSPVSLPAWYRVAGLPEVVTADTLGIAAHTLGSTGCRVRVARNASNHENLMPWSQKFSEWAPSATVSRTADHSVAPDGTKSAALISATAGAARTLSLSVPLPSPGPTVDYYFTLFVNRVLSSTGTIGLSALYSGGGEPVVSFNLDTGVITNAPNGSAFIEKIDDEWYRIGYRVQRDTTGAVTVSARVRLDGLATYVVWGGQLETRTTASSYLATHGAPVTSEWWALTGFLNPVDDSAFVALLADDLLPDNSFRIEITGPGAVMPLIGIMCLGERLMVPDGVVPDYSPVYMSQSVELLGAITRAGQFKGNKVKRRGAGTDIQLAKQERWWVLQEFEPFLEHYNNGVPFFWGSAPTTFPKDAAFCQRAGSELSISFGQGAMFADISLEVEAYVGS